MPTLPQRLTRLFTHSRTASSRLARRLQRARYYRTLETLETRQLMTALPFSAGYPQIFYDASSTLNYSYDNTSQVGTFAANALPLSFAGSTSGPWAYVTSDTTAASLTLTLPLNAAGQLAANPGAVPNQFTLTGTLNIDGTDYSGVLLAGTAVDFGFQPTTPNAIFGARIHPTTGTLLSFYHGNDAYVEIIANGSTFKNSFTDPFTAGIEGFVGPLPSLGGRVYWDQNNNGLDENEQGIPSTTVTLTGHDVTGATVNLTTTTAADGSYNFLNLVPSDSTGYTLTETIPTGYLERSDNVGNLGGLAATDEVISQIVIPDSGLNQYGTGYDFGNIKPVTIAGNVYEDKDLSGSLTPADAPIAGVVLTLSDNLGNVINTTTTAPNGTYSFTTDAGGNLLPPDTYKVTEAQPAGYLQGTDTIGTVNTVVDGTLPVQDTFASIVLNQGDHGVQYNFGEIQPASVSGYVYWDKNTSGVKDAADAPISNVTITLQDNSGNAVATTTTAADGSYSFINLKPGTYKLVESQPAGFSQATDNIGTVNAVVDGMLAVQDTFAGIVLAPTNAGINYNFGEIKYTSVAGNVYWDANNTGSFASNTGTPIAGVTIALENSSGTILATTTTNAAGAYSFTNLLQGTYQLVETQPAGYLQGTDTIGTVNAVVDGTLPVQDTFSSIVLNQGDGGGTNYNFGELKPAAVSGFVYWDKNTSGVKDTADAPISNVTITLQDSSGNALATTTTAADGSYSFNNLKPGTYKLVETQPAGYSQGTDNIGTVNAVVDGTLPVQDTFAGIVLAQTNAGINYNFGEIQNSPITICGTKYLDLTGNGLSADDTPLGGVTIKLYKDVNNNGVLDCGDGGAIASTLTATGTGTFCFNNLAQARYFVQEVVPTGYISTGPATITYYTDDATGSQRTFTNNDFANFKQDCCCGRISNITYLINGTTVVTDLRGNTHQGDQVEAIFTVNAGVPNSLYLVSYTDPENYFNANDASQQQTFELATGSFGPTTAGRMDSYV
ncbi:MAG: SdrD B-like domain-containing protein, partial [Phycisphaerae bacterium]